MTACSHTALLFDTAVSPRPICTLCGNGVRIVIDARLHPFDADEGRGLTALADTQPFVDHVDTQVIASDGLAMLRLREHFGASSFIQATARLTPEMAREIAVALMEFAEEAS